MLHPRFICRQLDTSRQQAIIFTLCVALSLLTLTSLGGFSSSVRRSTLRDVTLPGSRAHTERPMRSFRLGTSPSASVLEKKKTRDLPETLQAWSSPLTPPSSKLIGGSSLGWIVIFAATSLRRS